jgi:very-short-patch-repair endonuclease
VLTDYADGEPLPESAFESLVTELGFWTGRAPVRQHRLFPHLRWSPRFDLAWPHLKLAIELDSRSNHAQLKAFEGDRSRDRKAFLEGWATLRFTWRQVRRQPWGGARRAVHQIP